MAFWQRFARLPLTSVEKGLIYGAIYKFSQEELSELAPPFLDDVAVAAALKVEFLPEALGFAADWGTSSLLATAPASFNNDKARKVQQESPESPAVLNFRPSTGSPSLPLPLAHCIFGQFLDVFHGAPGASQPGVEDFVFFLLLSRACSRYYGGEVSEYRPRVRELWAAYTKLNLQEELFTGHISEKRSSATACDVGYVLSNLRVLILIMETKLGLGGTGADPTMHGIQNYRLYWPKVGDEARLAGTCYPAFLVEHVGPLIRVSGIANLDKISVQPLTPFINLLQMQGHDLLAAEQGVRLCLALKESLIALVAFYGRDPRAGIPRDFASGLPYPLHRKNCTATRWGNKHVYLLPEENTVVKYVQREYGEAVHSAWADAGYAPRLVQPVTRLPGGWLEVSMEYLGEGWRVLQSVENAEELRAQVVEVLRRAHQVPVGGAFGVHGDMRDINVMVKQADGMLQVKFIDFDWARQESDTGCPCCKSMMFIFFKPRNICRLRIDPFFHGNVQYLFSMKLGPTVAPHLWPPAGQQIRFSVASAALRTSPSGGHAEAFCTSR